MSEAQRKEVISLKSQSALRTFTVLKSTSSSPFVWLTFVCRNLPEVLPEYTMKKSDVYCTEATQIPGTLSAVSST